MSNMGSEAEPAKLLLPYLQRADELQKHEPLVAYYCRLYAMERGLKIPQKDRTKTTNALLLSLMNQLEKDKKSVKLGPDDYLYVEGFASNLFAKADKQDRAGRSDLNTAKTFYAASIFFEILCQFGELQPDIEQKQKYAVWKAADIRKALKEGRKPDPGPPVGDADLSISSSPSGNTYDLQPSNSFSPSQQDGGASSQHVDKNLGRNENFAASYQTVDLSSQQTDEVNLQGFGQSPMAPSSSSYTGPDYPSDIHHHQPTSTPDYSAYSQQYEHHSYTNEHGPMPPNSHSPENPSPSFSYPNFQSYPSFHDSTFPSAPTHQPSYYHAHDSAYSHQPAPVSHYTPSVQYTSGSVNQNHAVQAPPSAERYKYDSNYQPSAEKIAEAHKAARFAVGALAFDDVSVAVDFLQRSLELLTNPSAQTH
ncbi:hypothetical protein C4D60_Mb03t10350 [Musa balbisiana]|uniref:Vta1/callose synthase N-terminal domain-containing protein n=1 Tax=Musa balbisiana TaxID=52838 RepID=A0A4S8J8V5_MUSBA|nr:hypothetical protein C4D60_Mb03t10350 [Musa balbisiana]